MASKRPRQDLDLDGLIELLEERKAELKSHVAKLLEKDPESLASLVTDFDKPGCINLLGKDVGPAAFQLLNPGQTVARSIEDELLNASFMKTARKGPAVDMLYRVVFDDYLKKRNRGQKVYVAPYACLVAPSGVGKSFSMKQLGVEKGVYCIYGNFARIRQRGYPSCNWIGKRWFSEQPTFAAKLENLKGDDNDNSRPDVYRDFFRSFLICGYLKVIEAIAESVNAADFISAQINNDDGAGWLKSFDELYDQVKKEKSGDKVSDISVQNVAKKYLKGKINFANKLTDAKVLFIMDEARSLLCAPGELSASASSTAVLRSDGPIPDSLRGVRRVLRQLRGNVFALFADTSSRVANFAPPQYRDPTAKNYKDSGELFPPIYHLDTFAVGANWNVLPDTLAADASDLKVEDYCSSALFRIGRPLWAGLLGAESPLTSVLDLASEKLCAGPEDIKFVAMWSARLQFRVGSAELAESLLASNLRFVTKISADRTKIATYQPSEPILAEVACRQMSDNDKRRKCFEAFQNKAMEGLINIGDVGEIVGSMILLCAADNHCIQNEFKFFSRPIGVRDYLKSLLGETFVTDKIKTHGDSKAWEPVLSGTVYFTHFSRCKSGLSPEILADCYCRSVAIVCSENTTGIDLVIPVLMQAGKVEGGEVSGEANGGDVSGKDANLVGSDEEDNSPAVLPKRPRSPRATLFSRMTSICIQVKHKATGRVNCCHAESLTIPRMIRKHSMLIYMSLRAKEVLHRKPKVAVSVANPNPSPRATRAAVSPAVANPSPNAKTAAVISKRLSILACGVEAFPCIEGFGLTELLKNMLANHDADEYCGGDLTEDQISFRNNLNVEVAREDI